MTEAKTKAINADEFYLDDDMFAAKSPERFARGNDEQIDGLKDRLDSYRHAALEVVARWEQGDLAEAVRVLANLTVEKIEVSLADVPRTHPMFDEDESDESDGSDDTAPQWRGRLPNA